VVEILAPAHWIIELSTLLSGDLNEARKLSRGWRERFEAGPQGVFPINLSVTVSQHYCLAVHLQGGISEALKLCQESLKRARIFKQPFTLGMVLIHVGWLYQVRREPEAVREGAEAAMALGEEHGFPEWLEWGRWLHGWALTELGTIEQGVAEMEAGIAGFVPMGGVPRQAFTAAILAKVYEKLGRIDQAIAMLDDQLVRIERSGERLDEAELYRVKGELLYARDGAGSSEGESCLRKAIEIARRQESRWWELRATMHQCPTPRPRLSGRLVKGAVLRVLYGVARPLKSLVGVDPLNSHQVCCEVLRPQPCPRQYLQYSRTPRRRNILRCRELKENCQGCVLMHHISLASSQSLPNG